MNATQGHVYNSTSRIRNRKEKRSWLGFAQVGLHQDGPHKHYSEVALVM